MSRSSIFEMLIESTLRELESELESETRAEYDTPPPPIPNYKWKIYTNDKDDAKNPWRLHREIPPRRVDTTKLRQFEGDCLRKLAPTVGPLASQIAIQRCSFDGNEFVPDDPLGCHVFDLTSGNISTCTRPRPPVAC